MFDDEVCIQPENSDDAQEEANDNEEVAIEDDKESDADAQGSQDDHIAEGSEEEYLDEGVGPKVDKNLLKKIIKTRRRMVVRRIKRLQKKTCC